VSGGLSRIVLGNCGHWWHESAPEGVRATSPRVCTQRHTQRQRDEVIVGKSPQGFDLVEVAYADPAFIERVVLREES
jgi:hypothetical protein